MTSGAGIVVFGNPRRNVDLRNENSSVAIPRVLLSRDFAYGDNAAPTPPADVRKPMLPARKPKPSTASMKPADQLRRRNSPSVTEGKPTPS